MAMQCMADETKICKSKLKKEDQSVEAISKFEEIEVINETKHKEAEGTKCYSIVQYF